MTQRSGSGPVLSMTNPEDTQPDPTDALRTQRSDRSRGRRRANAAAGGAATPITGSFDHLTPMWFVSRESPEYGYLLLDKMIEQILDPYRHIPAVEVALSYGSRPMWRDTEGEKVREELRAQSLYSSEGTRKLFGVRFEIDGHWFQYGLTSGARPGLNGDNDWVESLRDGAKMLRPERLVTGPLSRLARLEKLFMELADDLHSSRTLVVPTEAPAGIDLATEVGKMQWQALAKAAEADYRATVMRLLTGVIFELKNDRYPRAEKQLLLGYHKPGHDKDKHIVRPSDDPVVRAQVAKLIELAASPLFTETQIATELAKLGLTSRWPGANGNDPRAVDQVADPVKLVQGLFAGLPTYLDGKYLYRHELPLPNLDTIHGLPVRRFHPGDYGYIEKELNFGLPDGGWADPDLILEAIRLRSPAEDARTPLTKDKVKPLAGLVRWSDDEGWEYCLLAKDSNSYEYRRRKIAEGQAPPAAFTDADGELIGRFSARKLHAAFADLLRHLAGGAPAALHCPEAPPVDLSKVNELEEEKKQHERDAAGFRQEAVRAESQEEKEQYREDARKASAAAAAVAADIAQIRARHKPLPRTVSDARTIAALIALLEDLPGTADVAVARRIRSLVSSLKIVGADKRSPSATLEAVLTLGTDAGAITVGPLRTSVQNRAVGGKPGTDSRREGFAARNRALVTSLLLEGGDEEERRRLWSLEDFNARSYTRRMMAALQPIVGTYVASAVIDCPIVGVRRAALARPLEHGLDLIDGLSEDLAEEIAGIYVPQGFTWTKGWCPGGMARERQVLAFLDRYANPEEGLPLNDVRDALGLDSTYLYRLAHTGRTPYSQNRLTPGRWYGRVEIVPGEGGPRSPGSRVRVRSCPHCGARTLLQPLRAPEVAGYLLCTADGCRKALLSGRQYPAVFFEPWDGPQSFATRGLLEPGAGDERWLTVGGRVIVGTTRRPVQVPSRYAPRGQ